MQCAVLLEKGDKPHQFSVVDDAEGRFNAEQLRAPDLHKVGNLVSNKVDTGGSEESTKNEEYSASILARRALQRATCNYETREKIFQYVPEARNDKVLFRYIVYALCTTWRDRTTNRRVLHHKIVMGWIGHDRRSQFSSAKDVLEYIKTHLPIQYSNSYSKGSHTRQLINDGLPEELWKVVRKDLTMPPQYYSNRVCVLSGDPVSKRDAKKMREDIRDELPDAGPSPTSKRIRESMNDLPVRRFARFEDKIEEALEHVDRMEIDVQVSHKQKATFRYLTGCKKQDDGTLTGNVERYKARLRHERRVLRKEQRSRYKQVLHKISLQHKPFYGHGSRGRTDRIFGHNTSALDLPSEVRDILCAGLYDVDLKSAHLLIAAWLWGAEKALETLTQDGYSIWDDLIEHCRPLFEKQGLEVPEKGSDLYDEVKAGMKIMVYSTVYGMHESAIQGEVTKSLKHLLGPDVGDHLTSHHVIKNIRKKRDEVLSGLEPGDTLKAPSGIKIDVEVGLEEEECPRTKSL